MYKLTVLISQFLWIVFFHQKPRPVQKKQSQVLLSEHGWAQGLSWIRCRVSVHLRFFSDSFRELDVLTILFLGWKTCASSIKKWPHALGLVVADSGTRWAGEGASVRGLRMMGEGDMSQNVTLSCWNSHSEIWPVVYSDFLIRNVGWPCKLSKPKFDWIHVDRKMFLLEILEGDLHRAFALCLWRIL